MRDLQTVIFGLEASLPQITFQDLLDLDDPSAEFEAHVPAEVGDDYWIYSVDGKLLDGDVMVVRAPKFMAQLAETRAQEGLAETIAALRRYDVNTGLQITAETRGVQ